MNEKEHIKKIENIHSVSKLYTNSISILSKLTFLVCE